MNTRKTLSRLLPISLTLGLLTPACDGGGSKPADANDAKAAAKTDEEAVAKADEATPVAALEADAAPGEAGTPEADGTKGDAEAADAAGDDADEDGAKGDAPDPAPAADEPAADEPAADEPAADEPKADEPKAAKPKAAKPKADKPKPEAPPPEAASSGIDGKALYLKKCKNCHGTTGAADTKLAAKHDIASWKEPGWKGKWTLSKVSDIVTNGKSGTKMKAFKGKLTPEEIDAVSVYARSLGK